MKRGWIQSTPLNHCKGVTILETPTNGGEQQLLDLHAVNSNDGHVYGNSMANFVTESGFYDVILQSSSPNVKPFRKWAEISAGIRFLDMPSL